ncbi:MAG: hypothetical protein HY023_11205 [Chloroflexi bacterium]|nr:hypothetical protein [Chloroflexota bacterium]
MRRLSVIIPALNETATLPGLLAALRRQTRPPGKIEVLFTQKSYLPPCVVEVQ